MAGLGNRYVFIFITGVFCFLSAMPMVHAADGPVCRSPYDVGTAGALDREQKQFDTPTLIELWRTAPFLHDGSAPTLLDLLTAHNKGDAHGKTSKLSKEDLDALVEYLLSL